MKKLPFIAFAIFFVSAVFACYDGYMRAARCLREDLNQALDCAIAHRGLDVMRQDSIRAYRAMAHHDGSALTIILRDKALRRHLRYEPIKEVAYIACEVKEHNGNYDVRFRSEAPYTASMLFSLSDQRLSFALSIMALLSLMFSYFWGRKDKETRLLSTHCYGGLRYDGAANRFMTEQGAVLHLTPMQFTLLKMFFDSETHTLSKQAICEALWPKKPDANDTLYTLIRRLKPVIEAHSHLRIESDRGRSYTLTHSNVE